MDYKELLKDNVKKISKLQDKLYAQDKYSVLVIFQALDAAGKDSTIKHVFSGVNPQGCVVHSFKKPTKEEYDHHFLWKGTKCLPERGIIGVYNRSYYEEVIITQVHPELIVKQRIPGYDSLDDIDRKFWKDRYQQINDFERNLSENGTIIIKFYLDISKEEQRNRFIRRIENPDKNWKFEMGDLNERLFWDDYQIILKDVIKETNTKNGRWYKIPADDKPKMRYMVSEKIIETLEKYNIDYPEIDDIKRNDLKEAKERLKY